MLPEAGRGNPYPREWFEEELRMRSQWYEVVRTR
jgi:hypothetical protein